jgi:hypothetical protein
MRPAWIHRLLEAEELEPIPPPREADRRAAIGAIEAAIRRRGAARARARVVWTLGAAAAVVLAAGGGALLARRGPSAPLAVTPATAAAAPARVTGDGVVVDGAPARASAVGKGGRVVVRQGGHATIALPTGTELGIDERGELAVVEDGRAQIFSLTSGSLRAHVAKLGPGERFVVRTPDAEVEVRGTVFTVSLVPPDPACGEGTMTRVVVDEGVVAVRRRGEEARVAKGERWPSGCDSPTATATATAIAASTSSKTWGATASKQVKKQPAASASEPPSPSSSLAEQNALFAEGLAYKNGGQPTVAIGIFEQLMAKYPGSPLAENAAVERMRLLASVDRARAAAAAAQYLKRYPDGFGKAEAKALAGP